MGKKLIILVVILVILTPIVIIGVDVGLTISSLDPSAINVTTGSPTTSLSSDNTTLTFSIPVTVDTPQMGFIPKSISLTLQIYEGTTAIGSPITVEIAIGGSVTENISGEITLTTQQTQTISTGGSLTLTIKGTATAKMLGIALPGTEMAIPDQTITVP